MGKMTEVQMNDGVSIRVYRAAPLGTPRGGIVIMHEAYGMNDHIRGMCERYAAEGYLALAPALYDRVEHGVEIPGYSDEDLEAALRMRKGADWDRSVEDMRTVVGLAREAGPVGVVGYCWGGSLAWLAATRCGVDAAVSYYGGQIIQFIDETPGCPFMAHFAEHDVHVPPESASVVEEHYPNVPVYMYDANHGFNCDQRVDYDADSAAVAQERTFGFFVAHLSETPAAAAGE
jgi:carboxymethylenebutenolidase